MASHQLKLILKRLNEIQKFNHKGYTALIPVNNMAFHQLEFILKRLKEIRKFNHKEYINQEKIKGTLFLS